MSAVMKDCLLLLYTEDEPAIVSPAYFMFEIIDNSILNEDYLMMWFRRPEFDRLCWLRTDGSVRGGITWDDICRMKVPVPPLDEQIEIVQSYQAITDRIALKKQINDNLEYHRYDFLTKCAFRKENGVQQYLFPMLCNLLGGVIKNRRR